MCRWISTILHKYCLKKFCLHLWWRVNLTSSLLHPKPDRWWVGRNQTVALLPLRKMLLSSPLSKLVKCPSPKLKLRTEVGVIKLWRYYPFQQHHHSEQCILWLRSKTGAFQLFPFTSNPNLLENTARVSCVGGKGPFSWQLFKAKQCNHAQISRYVDVYWLFSFDLLSVSKICNKIKTVAFLLSTYSYYWNLFYRYGFARQSMHLDS